MNNLRFCHLFRTKTCFRFFASQLGCSGLYVTKRDISLFLLLNCSVSSFMTTKWCFRLFLNEFLLFSALFHWTLFWALMQLNYTLFRFITPKKFFRLLLLNWADSKKTFICLFLSYHPDVSQTTIFLFLLLNQAVFSFIEPETSSFSLFAPNLPCLA